MSDSYDKKAKRFILKQAKVPWGKAWQDVTAAFGRACAKEALPPTASLTILTPGIRIKKPIKLPQWKLDLILDVVHMSNEKLSFISHYRIAAIFKNKPAHVCPKGLNPKTERCNMPGHPFIHTKFCKENDTDGCACSKGWPRRK